MRLKVGKRLVTLLVVPVALATVTALLTVAGAKAKDEVVLATFDTPGKVSWTVPTGVDRITFDVYGAAGGGGGGAPAFGRPSTDPGGLGGRATATFVVMPGQVFQIMIGGKGATLCETMNAPGGGGCLGESDGGFNGGGRSDDFGGGGGGASDVRTGFCALAGLCELESRIVVAGGGGGGGDRNGTTANCAGGGGGGVNGESSACPFAQGGSQSRGGSGNGVLAGGFGFGGWGVPGGGGGGGWYGGAGGAQTDGHSAGGGGGSSHIAASALWPMTTATGVNSGNGKVVVIAGKP